MLDCHLLVNVQQSEVKAEQTPVPNKKEAPTAAETNVSDAPSGKKRNSAKRQKTEPGNEDDSIFMMNFIAYFLKIKPFFFLKCSRRSPHFGEFSRFCKPPGCS